MDSDPKTLSLKPGTSSPPGRLRLLVIAENGSKSLLLPEHASLSVGRGADVDLRLDDHAVSRKHLLLHLLGDHVRVEDLGSANGTRVRGRELGRSETVDLQPGDAVEIGRTVLVLQRALSSQTRRIRLHAHDDFVARIGGGVRPRPAHWKPFQRGATEHARTGCGDCRREARQCNPAR